MGQFLLFFAGLLITTIMGVLGNWIITSWYYYEEHPDRAYYPDIRIKRPYVPLAAFLIIGIALFVTFWFIATYIPSL